MIHDYPTLGTLTGWFVVDEYVNAWEAPAANVHFCNNHVRHLNDKPPAITLYRDRLTDDILSVAIHFDGYNIHDKQCPMPMTWRAWLRDGWRLLRSLR